MTRLPSRHRRLDEALADLPLDEPMLLSELDGFLTGIALCSDPIPPAEWMQHVWGTDDSVEPPFEHPEDVAWFAQAVGARLDEIVRDLIRGKPRPIFEIDERNGEVLWEIWIEGFAEAMAMRPDTWLSLVGDERDDANDALLYLTTLVAVARNESTLDSVEINEMQDDAPGLIAGSLAALRAARARSGIAPPPPAIPAPAAKVGRNDPCPCGSGKKAKRCCA